VDANRKEEERRPRMNETNQDLVAETGVKKGKWMDTEE
jgi:hypothetical protein